MFKCKRDKPVLWTWQMVKNGTKVQTICDYILTGKTIQWKNFKIIDTNIEMDNRLIKAKYISEGNRNFRHYTRNKETDILFCIEEYEE